MLNMAIVQGSFTVFIVCNTAYRSKLKDVCLVIFFEQPQAKGRLKALGYWICQNNDGCSIHIPLHGNNFVEDVRTPVYRQNNHMKPIQNS